jgi:hypothetical protein
MRSQNDYGFLSFTDNDASEDLVQLGVLRSAADTGNLLFYTNGGNTSATERMRVDSAGRVLIGTTSGTSTLTVSGDIATSGDVKLTVDDEKVHLGASGDFLLFHNGSANYVYGVNDHPTLFHTNNTERMRIAGDGSVRINSTGAVDSELFTVQKSNAQVAYFDASGTSDVTTIQCRNRRATGTTYGMQMEFRISDGSTIGYISTHGSNCLFGNNSDYRLKENVVNLSNGITRLKNLKPYRFNFKATPDETVDGFYAHEASTVVGNAVVGDKDAVNDDGSIKPQAMDNAKLVPLLTAALQEAITKIETLETKVAALESS